MHPKDAVLLALALALCAMGFFMVNLLRELWCDAAFAGLVMAGAAGYVLRFIARAQMPQAHYRAGRGG